jgi:hypothetical protein
LKKINIRQDSSFVLRRHCAAAGRNSKNSMAWLVADSAPCGFVTRLCGKIRAAPASAGLEGSFPRKSTAFCKMRQDGQPRSAVLDAMTRAGAVRMGGIPLLKHEERLVIGDTAP